MNNKQKILKHFIKFIIILSFLSTIVVINDVFILNGSATKLQEHLYTRIPLLQLLLTHFSMVGVSTFFAVLIGVSIGIFVTRKAGEDFLYTVNSIVSLGQTFPPIAVIALAVPMVGFGFKPTVLALFIYGLLPIVRSTITGIESISPEIKDTARAIGMTRIQTLIKVELPLAFKVILSGIRITTIINIGTATLGATIGASGLGSPIIEGIGRNPIYVIEGSFIVAISAILSDSLFDIIESYSDNPKP